MDVPIFDSTAVAEPRKPRRLSDVGFMEATSACPMRPPNKFGVFVSNGTGRRGASSNRAI